MTSQTINPVRLKLSKLQLQQVGAHALLSTRINNTELEANQVSRLPHNKVVFLKTDQLQYLNQQTQIAQINTMQAVLYLTYKQTPNMPTLQKFCYITSRFIAMALICRIAFMSYRYIKEQYELKTKKLPTNFTMNEKLSIEH